MHARAVPLTQRQVRRCAGVGLVIVALIIASPQAGWAGGPGPTERLFQFGRCGGDTPCSWDCNEADNPRCVVSESQCLPPAPLFAARIRLSVDDQVCPGSGGSRLTIAMVGQRSDGAPFTIPDTTIDFCGVPFEQFECGGSFNLCPDVTTPRETMFLCSTNVPNGVFDETTVPDTSWLQYSNFLPSVAQALAAEFAGVAGEPIILAASQRSYDDQVGSQAPSVRDMCVTGTFGTLTANSPAPPQVAQLPVTTSTATLDLGDCPTLPIVTTTTTTTSTTLPADPCGGLAAEAVVVCVVNQGVPSCPDRTLPANVRRLLDRAAALVAKAEAAAKPRRRAARLVAAEQRLRTARRSLTKRPRLDAACRDALQSALEKAITFVRDLRL